MVNKTKVDLGDIDPEPVTQDQLQILREAATVVAIGAALFGFGVAGIVAAILPWPMPLDVALPALLLGTITFMLGLVWSRRGV